MYRAQRSLREAQALLCLGLSVVFSVSCGAERELSGIWQQAPLLLPNQEPDDELAWDEGLSQLYELHLGRYADRVTGVLVRYQTPGSRFLSPFDRADRCSCELIYQGSALSEPDRLAFGLLDPATPRSVDVAPSCELEPECQRVFKLTLEGDELVGTTWCEGQEGSPQQLRLIKAVGLSQTSCEPRADEETSGAGAP